MGLTLSEKIIKEHLVYGEMKPASSIAIRIDNTLTQDSTGTMAYLQYEAITNEVKKTKCSVAYIDHNMLQTGPENMDDHIYIQSVADKAGVIFSKAGNGICHRLNLDRFSAPGETLLGSDSHTPTCGAVGMIAIGAGGLDVAAAMAGKEYYLNMPKIIGVKLTGELRNETGAKDVILEVLRQLSVKGGVGCIIEYFGAGVKSLGVSQRATITNMGAELGATTSIFPSDERTKLFFDAQNRSEAYKELYADDDCEYYKIIEINLSNLTPLAAAPHMPDIVKPVSELAGLKVDQICVGSCTNSSYEDMMTVASVLKGKTIAQNLSFTVSCGSRQVLSMLSENGALNDLLNAGARILECGCGPCIGMGQSPNSNGVSLRTFNRNFKGRSGTTDAMVYLVSPQTAAASALSGYITDPSGLVNEKVDEPSSYVVNDNMFIMPSCDTSKQSIKGPNIKPFPKAEAIRDFYEIPVATKLGDNITTDDIMPSNAKLLPYRSNIEYLSNFCLTPVDESFPSKAKAYDSGCIIVGGSNYGQGSSREHAALVPLYLGVKAVIAKSFARIHKNNLINNGILPLIFACDEDYDNIAQKDVLVIEKPSEQLNSGCLLIKNKTKNVSFTVNIEITEREKELLIYGGLINMIKAGK